MRMRISHLLLFVVVSILFSSCDKKDETGDLEINFVARYDDKPLVWNQNLTYNTTQAIKYDRLDMFISNLELRQSDGSTLRLSDVELLRFMEEQVDESSAIFGITLKFNDIEPGAYSNIDMGIGVSNELNNKNPSEFNSSHPLSAPSYYWDSWDGYIFTKMEGAFAEDGEDFSKSFVFHTGTSKAPGAESAYRPVSFERGIEIRAGHTTRVNFLLDAKMLFEQPGNTYIDIATKSGAHSLSDTLFMNSIMGNFSRALKVKSQE